MSDEHTHCYHYHTGPLHMVIPDGHVVLKCCSCGSIKTEHGEHFLQGRTAWKR